MHPESWFEKPTTAKIIVMPGNQVKAFTTAREIRLRVPRTNFDNYTAGISASGAAQHNSNYGTSFTSRCNVTAIQRWRNTDGATLTTRMQYDDAGNVLSSTDPLNHQTTTSYADVWTNSSCTPTVGNAAAFPTQITDPMGHITKHSYNSCTGTLASTTDPNNLVTSLSYDLMDRLVQTNSPDGAQTSTCFSEVSGGSCFSSSYPLSVVTTQKITSSTNKTSTTLLDGLARVTETQLNSDPDCSASGGVKVDITYDGAERKSTVSNPYCTTSDPTYGLTTYNYDAFDRATKVIPPDGTSGTNNVFTAYDIASGTGNCTTVTDQAGNQRRSCMDGLGRLVEVDEPGAGSSGAGTSASGSVSVSGNEQNVQTVPAKPSSGSLTVNGSSDGTKITPATAGTGSVTVSGSERSIQITYGCGPNGQTCTRTQPDAGNVTITVNGYAATYNYQPSDTSATVASGLASKLNGSGSVSATSSGSTVYITARTTGSSTNYSLSASSATTVTQYFTGTSFPVSTSGATLTGGQNQTSTYDTGNVSVTVGGPSGNFTASVSYGSSSTGSALASALASGLSGSGSPVTATASGSTLTLTSTATGSNTTYGVTTSAASTAGFSSPSFSASPSSSNLSGGANAQYAYDSGTVSITVGSYTATVNYSSGSTPSSIASALAGAFGGSGINASASGTTVTLTTAQTGSSENMALSASSATSQPGTFSTSFSASPSGSTLTGGTDWGDTTLNTPIITLYGYDPLNNLVCAVQNTGTNSFNPTYANCQTASTAWRPRSFLYDSLSELLQAKNPESSTISYTYDADGNVLSKTDSRPVTTNYSYDADNRVYKKAYTDGTTATVTYGYDGVAGPGNCPPALSAVNAIGKRTSMCDVAGTESWSYPITSNVGWETIDKRTTNGITKTTTTQDNLAALPYTIAYPSGRTITYSYSGAARPTSAVDVGNNINYVTGATYAPFGGLKGMNQGSSITVSDSYNVRLQPSVLSATGSAGTVLSLTYNFGLGSADNGNVYQIANGKNSNRTQNFAYDPLNRIAKAWSSGSTWGEQYSIDPWGNMTTISPISGQTYYEGLNAGTATAKNQVSGYGYDAAGNMTQNGSAIYSYDAENHLISTAGVNYTYDGDGERVMKSTGPIYWGEGPLAESDLSGNIQHEYIFFGGARIARFDFANSTQHYYFSDHLGSHDVVTNATGSCEQDIDFYPYGGVQTDYCPNVSQNYKFTGKERDSESGLDYFNARHYTSSLGRFMSVDPVIITPERKTDPQQLNRYAYVRNNPVRLVDPTGETLQCTAASGDGRCYCFRTLEQMAGGAASWLSMDANGFISFNAAGLDLKRNEGALLLNQLVGSSNAYGLAFGNTIDSAAGPQPVDLTGNLPVAIDQTNGGAGGPPLPSQVPSPGLHVTDEVVVNPDTVRYDTHDRRVMTVSLAFHELAEAYSKIEGGMGGGNRPYSDFQMIGPVNATTLLIGPPQAGAHNVAFEREYKFNAQNPSVKGTGMAGDSLHTEQMIRDKHN